MKSLLFGQIFGALVKPKWLKISLNSLSAILNRQIVDRGQIAVAILALCMFPFLLVVQYLAYMPRWIFEKPSFSNSATKSDMFLRPLLQCLGKSNTAITHI